MLFVHETHRVAGRDADRFEELYRDGWAPALADGDDARLLWFLHQAHGTGAAYVYVTVTALRTAADLDALNDRVRRGDLHEWSAEVDGLRHECVGKVLEPLPFSPLTEIDLSQIPATGSTAQDDGSLPLFMEDTAWPHRGRYDDYLAGAGTLYVETLRKAAEAGHNLLDLVAAFSPTLGAGRFREIVLWQRVAQPRGLLPLFAHEVPPPYRKPGTWMHDALDLRDQWESRLLRAAPWSPMG